MSEFGSLSANVLYGGFDVPVVTGANGPVVSLPCPKAPKPVPVVPIAPVVPNTFVPVPVPPPPPKIDALTGCIDVLANGFIGWVAPKDLCPNAIFRPC